MPVYINKNSIRALRIAAEQLLWSVEFAASSVKSIGEMLEENREIMGPYAEMLEQTLDDISARLKEAEGPAEVIAKRNNWLADLYQEMMDDDLFSIIGDGGQGKPV